MYTQGTSSPYPAPLFTCFPETSAKALLTSLARGKVNGTCPTIESST